MRLLEPLQGLKMGQGHFLIHLTFFISMCLLDTDINKNLKDDDTPAVQDTKTLIAGQPFFDMTESAIELQEAKENELMTFHLMKWGHLMTFTFQLLFLFLKEKGYFNLAQVI